MTDVSRHRRRPATILLRALHNHELVDDVLDELHAAELTIVLARRFPRLAERSSSPTPIFEGAIKSYDLIGAAEEYDLIGADPGGEGFTSAADFVAWFLVDVRGTQEAAYSRRRKGEAA